MEEEKYPLIPEAVITYLEKAFPNTIPMGEITARELGIAQGMQMIINHLKTVKQWSEEKDV